MNRELEYRRNLLLNYSAVLLHYANSFPEECFVVDSTVFRACCYIIIQLANAWQPNSVFDELKSKYPLVSWRQIRAFRNYAAHPPLNSEFDLELFREIMLTHIPTLARELIDTVPGQSFSFLSKEESK